MPRPSPRKARTSRFSTSGSRTSKKGFAIGAFNLILRTDDGGQSWTPWLDPRRQPQGLAPVCDPAGGGSVFIVGEQGLVLKLDRERQRFVSVPFRIRARCSAWSARRHDAGVRAARQCYRSVDGGASWSKVETGVARV
jgi:photosystem II stability/assembly factor-like uncharacterized protein